MINKFEEILEDVFSEVDELQEKEDQEDKELISEITSKLKGVSKKTKLQVLVAIKKMV